MDKLRRATGQQLKTIEFVSAQNPDAYPIAPSRSGLSTQRGAAKVSPAVVKLPIAQCMRAQASLRPPDSVLKLLTRIRCSTAPLSPPIDRHWLQHEDMGRPRGKAPIAGAPAAATAGGVRELFREQDLAMGWTKMRRVVSPAPALPCSRRRGGAAAVQPPASARPLTPRRSAPTAGLRAGKPREHLLHELGAPVPHAHPAAGGAAAL